MNKTFTKAALSVGAIALSFGSVGLNKKISEDRTPARSAIEAGIGSAFKKLALLARSVPAQAQTQTEIERLVLIKSLYYFINGGTAGTWPDGASGSLSGSNAPDGMEGGFLGIMNNIMGPSGAVSEYLEGQGYTTCDSLPSTSTTFNVSDSLLGTLSVEVGSSSKAIPSGLTNSGNFEKRIFIAQEDGTAVAAIHLHCSGDVQTILVRANIELDTPDQIENIEAITEGTTAGPDMMLEIFVNNGSASQDDLAMRFETTTGDDYEMYVNHNSQANDSNGNGPAHLLAGVKGSKSSGKAAVAMMAGDHSTGQSASSGLSAADGLAYDAAQTPDQFAASNVFCVNTSTAATTTGCETIPSPGTPKFTGMSAWTITAMRAVRSGGLTMTTLNTTNY